ncbi:cobalamin biosynthesis protein CbiM [Fibrobacteria bacterium R8-3-H12]
MHMADTLLSPVVGTAMCAVSIAANVYAVKKITKDDLCEKNIPVMGLMGAFVFAAQMLNFTIPGTGSSGHIVGSILLAAMIGCFPALLSISAVLIVQCLFFADGGLLALGCNIFNMGVIPCLIVYPLVFKPLAEKGMTMAKITAASVAATVISLQLGAFGVVLETQLSGITALPFSTFLFLMLPIHLAIGFAEGIFTAAALCSVYKMKLRPKIITLALAALLMGGALSMFASSYPDGLEWSVEKATGATELESSNPIIESVAKVQEAIAFMPGYDFKSAGEEGSAIGTPVAGIAGGVLAFLLAGIAALAISAVKKRQKLFMLA